jgi:uncharacterized membrane-anchored protein
LVPDTNNVAHALRIHDGKTPLQEGAFLLRFHAQHGRAEFVPDSFFFQEGKGKDFQPARYGIFKVGADGDSVLTGLAGENRLRIDVETRIKTEF